MATTTEHNITNTEYTPSIGSYADNWRIAVDTHHTTKTIAETNEITMGQVNIIRNILRMNEKYDITADEFKGILLYMIQRDDMLENATLIEDLYFEYAVRLLKGKEYNKWIGDEICKRLNPNKNFIISTCIVKIVESTKEENIKPDKLFAITHKILSGNIIPYRYSSCALIINTMYENEKKNTPPGDY